MLFAYEAQDAGEIPMPEGAIVNVTSQDQSGWWTGECNGKTGVFPSNFTEPITEGTIVHSS